MVEIVIALVVLSLGFLGVAASMGLGFQLAAQSRQRQAAAEVANDRVEHSRNVPYDQVALSSSPAHATDPQDPDYYVSGTQYDVGGKGQGPNEDLAVDTAGGQIQHLDTGVAVGTTGLDVYQYITWVDDPTIGGAHDYKRITVVARYDVPARGVQSFVRVSALVSSGDVNVGGVSQGATQGSPTPVASPTATPSGSCAGDTTPPTGDFTITSGSGSEIGYTSSRSVTITMNLSDPCQPIEAEFSNDGVSYGEGITYDANNPSVAWTLTAGDGTKSVYGKFEDGNGNKVVLGPKTIVLDTIKPTVPGTLAKSVSCSGSYRTVTLSWGASTDTNLRGYRVYQSINSGAWTVLLTTGSTSANPADTHSKTLDSVRYHVVGYDKAGNESDATNEVSLAKNQCS